MHEEEPAHASLRESEAPRLGAPCLWAGTWEDMGGGDSTEEEASGRAGWRLGGGGREGSVGGGFGCRFCNRSFSRCSFCVPSLSLCSRPWSRVWMCTDLVHEGWPARRKNLVREVAEEEWWVWEEERVLW